MALRAGKKIKSYASSFAAERTARVKARQRRRAQKQRQKTERAKARQAGKTQRTGFKQAGRVGKAQAIGAGGGYVGRQDMFGRVAEGGFKAATAAATGGASSLASGLGGLLGDFELGDESTAVSKKGVEGEWYENPMILLGGAALLFVLLQPKKGRR
jgi:hypothetical protein